MTYKYEYMTYPLPIREEFQILEETVVPVSESPSVQVRVRVDRINMMSILREIHNVYVKTHGERPPAFLLGWKAALIYDAQNNYYKSGTFDDIPIVVSEFIHPYGRGTLFPGSPVKLLKALVYSDAVLESDE